MSDGQLLVGRYRLVERLGAGGMSVVWRGFDEVLGRQVAVKVLNGRYAHYETSRELILAEAKAAARLSHPNLVNVYDYGESPHRDGTLSPFVVMELVEGPTLACRLTQGPLAWRTALRVCAEVAAGLAAAHARGLVHRDVTPANVILTVNGAKVVDFGIAAVVGDHVDGGADGTVLGTPAYLAPERVRGSAVTPATDVYGVGLLLYQALTGRLPWRAETVTEMIRANCYLEPAPMPAITGVPGQVVELCRRCLRKEPEQRPTSADVAQVLSATAGERQPAPQTPRSGEPRTLPAAALDMSELDLAAADLVDTAPAAALTSVLPAAYPSTHSDTGRRAATRRRRGHHVRVGAAAALLVAGGLLTASYLQSAHRDGGANAQASGPGGPVDAGPACAVRYHTRRDAQGTFAVELTLTNTGYQPINARTLDFTFPADQRVAQASGAEWTQSGRMVTVRPTADGQLAPHESVLVAFTGTYADGNPLPTVFALDGVSCAAEVAGATSTTGEAAAGPPANGAPTAGSPANPNNGNGARNGGGSTAGEGRNGAGKGNGNASGKGKKKDG